jgi:hypothetical protein
MGVAVAESPLPPRSKALNAPPLRVTSWSMTVRDASSI